ASVVPVPRSRISSGPLPAAPPSVKVSVHEEAAKTGALDALVTAAWFAPISLAADASAAPATSDGVVGAGASSLIACSTSAPPIATSDAVPNDAARAGSAED